MDATGLILLVLFLVGAGVAFYYAALCLQAQPRKRKRYSDTDEGFLLANVDSDLNGNHEEPILNFVGTGDHSKLDDTTINIDRDTQKMKSVSSQTIPPGRTDRGTLIDEASLTDGHVMEDHLKIASQDSVSIVMAATHGYDQTEDCVKHKDTDYPDTLSDSYEEDGLLVPRNTQALQSGPAPKIGFAEVEEQHKLQMEQKVQEPKKHVQFKPAVAGQPCTIETHSDSNESETKSDTQQEQPEVTPKNEATQSLENGSETDSSEPEVTEYSFQSGSNKPAASLVLADEVSVCSEPTVISFNILPESNSQTSEPIQPLQNVQDNETKLNPPTTTDESRENLTICNRNVIDTPPPDDNSNCGVENLTNVTSIDNQNDLTSLDSRISRKRSHDSTSSSSSSSSSSTDGSYHVQTIKADQEKTLLVVDKSKLQNPNND